MISGLHNCRTISFNYFLKIIALAEIGDFFSARLQNSIPLQVGDCNTVVAFPFFYIFI